MSPDYDKVIEFFSEHETDIYGLGPTDYGAEEGTLLWCIKELDGVYDRSKGIALADRDIALENQILNILCTLIDIYEKEDAEERELNSEITTLMNDLAAKELEVEYLKSKLIKEEEGENCETEPNCFNCRWCNTYTKWCGFSDESIDGRMNPCAMWECDPYEKEE